ncbi:MAG: 23S rRNA (uracil-5-)-methyltransferase RumA [Acidobacteria bacterium RBG_16_68_9]|nr:MAG: 23S rRNA (uracil-5-)-methyltransferase RumA [Acidobacteria bacterium RBG_16_68_9]
MRAAFAPYASLAKLHVPRPIGSPRAFGYRNQAKLVARRARRGLLLGVYRPGTHQVVDISACPVHAPLINMVLAGVRQAVERADVPVYDERTGSGWLRYVAVRVSQWQKTAQVILVVRERLPAMERVLGPALHRLRRVVSVVLSVNPTRGNVIFGSEFVSLAGVASLIERVGHLKLKSRAGAFLQANIAAMRRVYDQVLQWADPHADETAVDVYAGVGAISLWLGAGAGRVFGIEESPGAVLDAKENIRLNGFHNVRFICGAAETALPALAARLERIDLITVNPPRTGVSEATRRAIVECRIARLVYVSCDPATLARDLDWFAANGYEPIKVQPFDLFPQTEHVECVALLSRQSTVGSRE